MLNQVKNSDAEINSTMIGKAAQKILAKDKYKEYKSELTNAVHDITQYFDELDLYSYLKKIRNLNLKPQNIENTHDLIQLSSLFESHKIEKLDDGDNWYDQVVLIPTKANDECVYYYTWKGRNVDRYKDADTEHRYEDYNLPKGFIEASQEALLSYIPKEYQPEGQLFEATYKNGELTARDSLMVGVLGNIFCSVRELEVVEVVQAIYKKAQNDALNDDEKTFLDLYNLSKLEMDETKPLLHINDIKHYNAKIEELWNKFDMGEADPREVNTGNLVRFIQSIYEKWRIKLGYDPKKYRLDNY